MINYFKPDEEKTISVVPPNRPKVPEPAEDADEKDKARFKRMKDLADRADERDAIRAKHVCNSLAFRYPFNNRLHRDLHVDEERSLLDIMPDQWYVSRSRPLNPLWGKSGPERLVPIGERIPAHAKEGCGHSRPVVTQHARAPPTSHFCFSSRSASSCLAR